jgi:hypothetical protein
MGAQVSFLNTSASRKVLLKSLLLKVPDRSKSFRKTTQTNRSKSQGLATFMPQLLKTKKYLFVNSTFR